MALGNDINNGQGIFGFQPRRNGYVNYMAPHYEVIKVNGEAGANNFQMAPNSSQILLDNTNPNLIWLVQTDGAGYLTASPYDVFPHQVQPQINVNDLAERVKHLEEMYANFNSGSTKQSKKQRNNVAATATDSATAD